MMMNDFHFMNIKCKNLSRYINNFIMKGHIASLKEAEGHQLFAGALFIQCASCKTRAKGVKGVLLSEAQKRPKAINGARRSRVEFLERWQL